ncbi:cytidine deaminase [Silvibacterium dinghuense]|nr:cytidine deaminase [Silvibacterium dinghuense]GGG95517.1 cytidine deaminase [Silvibacterium dinghuense]
MRERLLETARAAAAHAYAPYSRFRVGAALLFEDGSLVTGCNVENVSFGLTSCAERNALFRSISERGAVAENGEQRRILAVAVTNLNNMASPPCGACRQVMAEFAAPGAVVLFPGETAHGVEIVERKLEELLPYGFRLDGV